MSLVVSALWIPLFGVAAVAATSALSLGRTKATVPSRAKPRAFLSYAHDDGATAARLKDRLKQDGIDVIIDADTMLPGERIPDFIDRSIRDCDTVVSLISSRSLMSSWVASETLAGIGRSTWSPNVAIFFCYLDDEWLQADFRLRCTAQIDERFQQIGKLLAEPPEKKIDAADLTDEQTRLFALRNNLGAILRMSRDSLCLDVRENEFEASATRLVSRIHLTFKAHKADHT